MNRFILVLFVVGGCSSVDPGEICDDGQDNNNNSLIDCADLGCAEVAVCLPELCSNGQDDNNNQLLDCQDPQCNNAPNCNPESDCDNNTDDDLDDQIDCADSDCTTQCQGETDCDNNIDDNQDGFTDCLDGDCSDSPVCNPETSCDNNIDDDLDGLLDCEDPNCENTTICALFLNSNLVVELTWNTPNADIDIHLLHPNATSWYQTPLDCHFANCGGQTPLSWPAKGADDDPRLTIDDVEGFGPEQIVIDAPQLNTALGYRFGAYNFTSDGDSDPNVTARIFCGGSLRATLTHEALVGSSTEEPPNELWKIADIFFTSPTECNVVPLDQIIQMGSDGAPR
jgi:hypothetical protein